MYPLSFRCRYRKRLFYNLVLLHYTLIKQVGNKMYTHFHQMIDLLLPQSKRSILLVRMIMSKFVASPPPPPLRKARGSKDTFNNIN